MCHWSCSLVTFYTKLSTKSAVSESSITLERLNLTFLPLGLSLWNLAHLFIMFMATKIASKFLILPRDLVMVFLSRKNRVKSSLNFERPKLTWSKIKSFEATRSALLLSFCENRFCLLQFVKKLNLTERGALFRHFFVSKVITTAHAHKSGVIFHVFQELQTKKSKALRPKMTEITSRGPALRWYHTLFREWFSTELCIMPASKFCKESTALVFFLFNPITAKGYQNLSLYGGYGVPSHAYGMEGVYKSV